MTLKFRMGGPYGEKLCPRSWVPGTQTESTVSPNMDRPRPENNIFIFFQLRCKSLRKIFLHSPTYVGWNRTRVRVDEAPDRLQTPPKYYNMIFSSVMYNIMALTKKDFCVLRDNS